MIEFLLQILGRKKNPDRQTLFFLEIDKKIHGFRNIKDNLI